MSIEGSRIGSGVTNMSIEGSRIGSGVTNMTIKGSRIGYRVTNMSIEESRVTKSLSCVTTMTIEESCSFSHLAVLANFLDLPPNLRDKWNNLFLQKTMLYFTNYSVFIALS